VDPKESVEADEMIHVHVADEDAAHPQEVARAQRRQVAHVEQQRLATVQYLDEQGRVAEPAVDQPRMEGRSHLSSERRAKGSVRPPILERFIFP
jgi:hypothetical protein